MSMIEQPITTEAEDKLRFRYLASVLASEITESDKSSNTWGIYGPWGSGKTSLINLVREKCDQKVLWVDFDAWLHQGSQGVLIPLLHQIASLRDNQKSRASFLRVVKTVVITGSDLFLRHMTKGMTVRHLIEHFEEAEKHEKKLPTDHKRQLRELFSDLVANAKLEDKQKVVVAVDNLDRCRPEAALATLEAMFLFLNHPECVFVIAADDATLADFISSTYSSANLSGWRYLEKVIPEYIRIPMPRASRKYSEQPSQADEVMTYLCHLLESVPALSKEKRLLWRTFASSSVLRNPRRMKRVIRELSRLDIPSGLESAFASILLLVAINDVWPNVLAFFQRSTEQEWDSFRKALLETSGALSLPIKVHQPDELRQLLRAFAKETPQHGELWEALDLLRPIGI